MALKREKKEEILESIKGVKASSKSLVFFDYQNIPTSSLNSLRDKLFSHKAKFSVFKNTLLKRVFGDAVPDLEGPTAVLSINGDPVGPVKELYEFKKENESINIKFGILGGKIIPQSQVDVLAELPSKEELIANVLGSLSNPVRGLAGVLSGVQRSFVVVLSKCKVEV